MKNEKMELLLYRIPVINQRLDLTNVGDDDDLPLKMAHEKFLESILWFDVDQALVGYAMMCNLEALTVLEKDYPVVFERMFRVVELLYPYTFRNDPSYG